MKKLFMFLASAAFISQAHAMEDREGEKRAQAARVAKFRRDNAIARAEAARRAAREAEVREEKKSIFNVENKTDKPITVAATIHGIDDSYYPGKPNRNFSIHKVGPGKTEGYQRMNLGREFRDEVCGLTRINQVSISFPGTNEPTIELGLEYIYSIGSTLAVTEELLAPHQMPELEDDFTEGLQNLSVKESLEN